MDRFSRGNALQWQARAIDQMATRIKQPSKAAVAEAAVGQAQVHDDLEALLDPFEGIGRLYIAARLLALRQLDLFSLESSL